MFKRFIKTSSFANIRKLWKPALVVISLGYAFNKTLNFTQMNKLNCDSNIETRYGKDNLQELEDSLNKKLQIDSTQSSEFDDKKHKPISLDDLDIPLEMTADEEQMAQIKEILENPELDPDTYRQLTSKSMNYQPPPFRNFNSSFKCQGEDDLWSGLKLTMKYSPIQTMSFEAEGTFESLTSKTMKYSIMSMNADKNDHSRGLIFVGRNDPSFVHSLQAHTNFGSKKVSFMANFKKNDPNQAIFEAEYSDTLDRMNYSVKYGNMGSSLSCAVNAWKDIHLGVEASLNKQTGDLSYSYGVSMKPLKKLGMSIVYLSYVPMVSFDLLFSVSLNIYIYILSIKY